MLCHEAICDEVLERLLYLCVSKPEQLDHVRHALHSLNYWPLKIEFGKDYHLFVNDVWVKLRLVLVKIDCFSQLLQIEVGCLHLNRGAQFLLLRLVFGEDPQCCM